MESARQWYINLTVQFDPGLVAVACRRLRRTLDYADDCEAVTLSPWLSRHDRYDLDASAWMTLALLIADACDVDSVTLNAIAKSVQTEVQDVIF